MRRGDPSELFEAARAGDRGALARLLTVVEDGGAAAGELARLIHPHVGRAHVVGITGAPGAGKSTLTNQLIGLQRAAGEPATVLAIDPSSPFTGGAILGDRVRMQDHAADPGVFIRSMATRGHLGGLSVAAPQAVRLLDAVGRPVVIVETVGVGQVEVEVAATADTTVVVVNPGWGDVVQANKAGLMEVADVFVINKADRPGAAETERDLRDMLALSPRVGWEPPIVATVATDGRGTDELWQVIGDHHRHAAGSGAMEDRRARRRREELARIVSLRLARRAEDLLGAAGDDLRSEVAAGHLDPWTAADRLLGTLGA